MRGRVRRIRSDLFQGVWKEFIWDGMAWHGMGYGGLID